MLTVFRVYELGRSRLGRRSFLEINRNDSDWRSRHGYCYRPPAASLPRQSSASKGAAACKLISWQLGDGAYSVRNATIGFTRVARRAGTKQEIAATRVSRPATTR